MNMDFRGGGVGVYLTNSKVNYSIAHREKTQVNAIVLTVRLYLRQFTIVAILLSIDTWTFSTTIDSELCPSMAFAGRNILCEVSIDSLCRP